MEKDQDFWLEIYLYIYIYTYLAVSFKPPTTILPPFTESCFRTGRSGLVFGTAPLKIGAKCRVCHTEMPVTPYRSRSREKQKSVVAETAGYTQVDLSLKIGSAMKNAKRNNVIKSITLPASLDLIRRWRKFQK